MFIGDVYFSPAIWGLFNQTSNVRNIAFPGFSNDAKATIHAWQLNPHLEIGYDIPIANSIIDVIPFTSIDWPINWQEGYTEQGASPFNATESAKTSSMVRSETGIKFCEAWKKRWGTFVLREKASYVFEKPFHTGNIHTAFVGTPGSFTVTALNQNLNLGVISLDFIAIIGKKDPLSLNLAYQGEFGAHYHSNQIMLTLSKLF